MEKTPVKTTATPLRLPAALASLQPATTYLLNQLNILVPEAKFEMQLSLVLEELLVNIASYAYPEKNGELEVSCHLGSASGKQIFYLCIKDWGIAYDPTARKELKHSSETTTIENAQIGGKGLDLVHEMTNCCHYRRDKGKNIFTAGFII